MKKSDTNITVHSFNWFVKQAAVFINEYTERTSTHNDSVIWKVKKKNVKKKKKKKQWAAAAIAVLVAYTAVVVLYIVVVVEMSAKCKSHCPISYICDMTDSCV